MIDSDETVDVDNFDLDAFSNELFGTPAGASEEVKEGDDEAPSTEETTESDDSTGGDTPANEADNEDEDKEPEAPRKGRRPARERIEELNAKYREAEREIERLRREVEEKARPQERDVDPQPTVKDRAPDPDDKLENGDLKYPLGEFDPAYIRDLTRHTIKVQTEEFERERAQELEARRIAEAEQELLDEWTERLSQVKESLPGFADNALRIESEFRHLDPEFGAFLATTIMSMDMGPEVLNYLGENIEEARAITKAGPANAIGRLYRIEGRLMASKDKVEKEKVKPSNAPEPAPVNRGSGGRFAAAPDTDDLDAFEKQFFKK